MKQRIIYIQMCFLLCLMLIHPVSAGQKLVIELDPGHGGYDGGATAEWFGDTVYEKKLNLAIAKYLKEELESYEGVEVKMTRTDDTYVSLDARTDKVEKDEADVMISLHNNASGAISDYDNGCTVLTSHGRYKEKLAQEGMKLGSQILEELSSVGPENQGILQRTSETGTTYKNGELADYYHIIKKGVEGDYTAIIVEHAFVDHGVDYKQYLRTDGALKRLAVADAKGIARYYGLHKKGESAMEPLANVKEKITLVSNSNRTGSQISYETFYKTESDADTEGGYSGEQEKGIFSTLKSLWKRFLGGN